MSPDQPPFPHLPPDTRLAGPGADPRTDPSAAGPSPSSTSSGAGHAHPGEAALPPADSSPIDASSASPPVDPTAGGAPSIEPRRADGARVWRVVRRPRWHERPDAHAPRRDVYYWLSTRRATSRASRPTSPDPHAR